MKKTFILLPVLASVILMNNTSAFAQCGPSMVQTTLGDTAVYTCPGDQMEDEIILENTAAGTDMFAYIVTDDQNMILMVPGDVAMIDVEEAGPGICRVWGLTYSGTLTADEGMDLMSDELATGCTQLSENFISLYRFMPEAGTLTLAGGGTTTTITTGDGVPDVVEFDTTGASMSNYAWIITDEESIILGVEHVPMHDFEPAGPGTCLVYGVSYTDSLIAPMGEDVTMIALSDDCFDLTEDYLTIVRLSVGINDASSIRALNIYPTIANELLTVELDASTEGSLEISDMQGRPVKAIPVRISHDRVHVNTADLAPGQYICSIISDQGKAVGRFIRE